MNRTFLHEIMRSIVNWDPNIKFFINGRLFNCLNKLSLKVLKNIFFKHIKNENIWFQICNLLSLSFELRYLY